MKDNNDKLIRVSNSEVYNFICTSYSDFNTQFTTWKNTIAPNAVIQNIQFYFTEMMNDRNFKVLQVSGVTPALAASALQTAIDAIGSSIKVINTNFVYDSLTNQYEGFCCYQMNSIDYNNQLMSVLVTYYLNV